MASRGLDRLPIESVRPVVSFAIVRVLLASAAVGQMLILGFPYGGRLAAVLAGVALPWSLAVLWLAHRRPSTALHALVAAGDFVVLTAITVAVPDTYGPVRFVALAFVAAHAHFQGERRGLIIGVAGGAALIVGAALRNPPLDEDLLPFYEAAFAVAVLGTAAIVGELRTSESVGRLRARELSRRTIAGEDEVRRRVADFIHDGPVQELIGLDFMLQGAGAAAERGELERVAELVGEARLLAEKNVRALRDEIVSLGPYAFEELSFEIAVEQCLPVWQRRWGCEVKVDAERVELAPEVANDLFRITQEAVANACKHGEAATVDVSLREIDGFAELRVRDYGKGFGGIDPFDPDEPGHIGLASMRERAALLYGHFEIRSLDDGVEVVVRVPRGSGRRRRER